MRDPTPGPVRLAELLASLSLVTDLARGHPPETAIRTCLLATALATELDLTEDERRDTYYATLLRSVGCTATSETYTAAFGDDIAVRHGGDLVDVTDPEDVVPFVMSLSEGLPPLERERAIERATTEGPAAAAEAVREDCEVGALMATRFDLEPSVADAVHAGFERWDGAGGPRHLAGDAIPLPTRIAGVAAAATLFATVRGRAAAVDAARRWSGSILDPSLAETFIRSSDRLLDAGGVEDPWTAILDREPGTPRSVSERGLEEVARGFADVVDLKSPYLRGHSSGVGALAEAAAGGMSLDRDDVRRARLAGWFHDVGRVGVPTKVWDKPGPLTVAEREAVRLHAYHSERVLARVPALADVGRAASMHHERLDGTGYHRGARAADLDEVARIVAAADVFHALLEERPHRDPVTKDEAANTLVACVGPLDRSAVEAVLEASGAAFARVREPYPADLTEREVEVLRLIARGRSEKDVAAELFISPATVHTHVLHVYRKAGVATRAGAAMFAMQHGLVSIDPT